MPGSSANCAGSDRPERGEAPRGDEQAGAAAGERHHEALGQDLRDDASARCADGAANRQLPLPAGRTRQQERGHVGARDEHHARDGAKQDEQRRTHVADEIVAQRPQVGAVVRVLCRVGLRQPRADEPQIFPRLPRRDVVAQPSEDAEEVRGAERAVVVRERQRHDDVWTRRPPELRRQHADDFERMAVEGDGAADHRRIGAEALAPQRVGQQDDAVPPLDLLVGPEVAPQRRRDAKHAEKRGRHLERAHALGLADAGQVVRAGRRRLHGRRHRGERPVLSVPVEIVGRRHRAEPPALARALLGERHHAVGARVRQRPPQHRVDDAEDGGARADAKGEREQRDGGEPWLPDEHPRAEADVLPHRVPHDAHASKLVADRRQRTAVRGPLPREGDREARRLPPEPDVRARAAATSADLQVLLVQIAGDRIPQITGNAPREQTQDQRNTAGHGCPSALSRPRHNATSARRLSFSASTARGRSA